jgi:amidase
MDLSYATATALTVALGTGEVSSRELLDHVADRIDLVNPPLNAVVTLDLERARRAAAAADDSTARGDKRGRLHGLVMTVKDAWETEGLRTTSGAPELREHIPAADAVAVRRLRDAGAIVVGKSNTPLYADDNQTFNDVFGQTNNPWDLERTPGGSSGGAAAAVAAGISALELGSDLGGSIRMPAHCCGVYGLKPTWGVVPFRGHIPPPPGTLIDADVAVGGPIARSVEDLRLALEVLAGPLDEERVAWTLTLPDDLALVDLRGLRLAVTFDDPDYPVAREVQAALRTLADALDDAGARVEEVPPPVSTFDAMESWFELVLPMMGIGLPDDVYDAFAAVDPIDGDRGTIAMNRFAARFRDRAKADQRRQEQRQLWATYFENYDAFLSPILPVPAFPHDNERPMPERTIDVNGRAIPAWKATVWASAIGAMLLPAAVVPAGHTEAGLPIGVQIVGPYLHDKRLLRIAALVDEAGPGFRRPPEY